MILPLQITSRNLELTEAIEADIREHAEKLDKYYGRMVSCRVTVEALPKRSLYNVHIDITVPGVGTGSETRSEHRPLFINKRRLS